MWRIRRRARTIRPGPWPFARPRVLIEHSDEAVAFDFVSTLRRAGYSVAICPGPSSSAERRERCVLVTGERCAFVDGADVVVSGLGVASPEKREVLQALRRHHPGKPIVVEVALEELHLYDRVLDGLHVVVSPVDPDELLAAVNDAIASAAPALASVR